MKIKRARDGYNWIERQVNVEQLLDSWADILKCEDVTDEHQAFVECCDCHGKSNAAFSVVRERPDPRFCNWVICQLLSQHEEASWALFDAVAKYLVSPQFLGKLKNEAATHELWQRALTGWFFSGNKSLEQLLPQLLTDDEQRIVTACYTASQIEKAQPVNSLRDEDTAILEELVARWPDIPAVYALDVLAQTGADIAPMLDRFLNSQDTTARAHAWKLCGDRARSISQGLKDPEWTCRVAAMESLALTATVDERRQLIALTKDLSANVRKAFALQIGVCQWSEGITSLIDLLRDHRDFGIQQDNYDYWRFEVAREACNALNTFPAIPDESLEAIRNFLGECTGASVDNEVHGLLFRIISKYPSKESMLFCSLYIKEIWLRSKWRESRGGNLLVQCLHTISEMLLVTPDLAVYLDMSNIEVVAARDSEKSGLVGSALVVLGLTAKCEASKLDKLAKSDSFSPVRARLLLALSESLQKNRPKVVMQHIPPRDPFITLLDWATVHNRQPPYDAFCVANPSVSTWVDSLKNNEGVAAYECWAISRLIGSTSIPTTFLSIDLPHPYVFNGK